jgi:hypothetical protein
VKRYIYHIGLSRRRIFQREKVGLVGSNLKKSNKKKFELTNEELVMFVTMDRDHDRVHIETCLNSLIPVHVLDNDLNLCSLGMNANPDLVTFIRG